MFDIINDGGDPMPFSTQAIVSETGWLQGGPAEGVVNRNSRIPVTVQVNQQNLDPGVYFGVFEVRSSQAAGEVRLLTVVLNVLPTGSQPPALVDPLGMLFVATAGGANPPARSVTISNLGAIPLAFTSEIFAEGIQNSIAYAPAQGQVLPNQPVTIAIQPTIAGLPEGVYRSEILLTFDDGTTRTLTPVLVVGPAGGATLSKGVASIDGCPTELDIAISSFSAGYPSYLDAPAFLRAEVADNCGQRFVEAGGRSVRAEAAGQTAFLSHRGDGVWEATIDFQLSGMQTVEVTAQDAIRGISGHATIAGGVQPQLLERPKITSGGVVHTASYRPAPLAPGSMISIYGENQSTSPGGEGVTTLPLPDVFAGTRVRSGGVFLPLFYSSQGQVNAAFPYDFNANAGPLSVVVFRGSVPSDPEELALTSGHPGLFTINSSGLGEGIFQDAAYRLISSSLPLEANPGGRTGISPGEPVVIYATGLGAVSPHVPSGQPAGGNPPSTVTANVQLTIGGQEAAIAFKGLTPGLVSLYQINATVPEGLPPGNADVILTVNGVSSPAGVTLSIE